METLLIIDQQRANEKMQYENIFTLLDYEKITFNGLLDSSQPDCLNNK